jgi:membrane protein implicated in regulation of membrane protease activity
MTAEHRALIWLAVGLVLLVLEIVAPGVFMMWLGLAALGTGLMVLVADLAFAWQALAFALLAALAIAVALRLRRRSAPHMLNTAESGLVGRTARLLTVHGGDGRVRVGDSDWSARLVDNVAWPEPGAVLRIAGVDGTTLLVAVAEQRS